MQAANSELPFGGVGMSGYGRYHGQAGFEQCSNIKSIFTKPVLTSFPYNLSFPPYTPSKIKQLTWFVTTFDISQQAMFKRVVYTFLALWVGWLIVTKRVTMKKLRKYKNMAKMLIMALRQ